MTGRIAGGGPAVRAGAGNFAVTGNLTVTGTSTTTGDATTTGNATVNGATGLTIGTAGGGLRIKEGANATMGRAVLVGGTVPVATTKVTAASEIFLTTQVLGGAIGVQYVSARTPGVSFTITSSSGTDTSTVAWLIVEPAP